MKRSNRYQILGVMWLVAGAFAWAACTDGKTPDCVASKLCGPTRDAGIVDATDDADQESDTPDDDGGADGSVDASHDASDASHDAGGDASDGSIIIMTPH